MPPPARCAPPLARTAKRAQIYLSAQQDVYNLGAGGQSMTKSLISRLGQGHTPGDSEAKTAAALGQKKAQTWMGYQHSGSPNGACLIV